ncbi:MAG TPA: helix-turn-helix domain-containing protein, partial [Myxococcales bacterium]|nr:helix-turn-helix domain-containing protein [Myxococcales bacterium]
MRGSTERQPLLEALGERVRALRRERGQTLRELAHRAGLSERFLSELESGRANISVLNLEAVAGALGVQAASLLA